MAEIVTPEAELEERSLVRRAVRFFDALPLVKRYFPLSLLLIILGSGSPNLFRWFTGIFVECINGGPCTIALGSLTVPVSLTTLGALVAICVISRGAAWIFINSVGKLSVLSLYRRTLDGLDRVRVTFFDENPSGRIRKRLTEDFFRIRNYAIWDTTEASMLFADILAAIALISLTSPIVAAGVIPIALLLVWIQRQDIGPLFVARSERIRQTGVVAQTLNDLLEGKSTFQLYGREEAMRARVASAYKRFFEANGHTTTLMCANRFKTMTVADFYSTIVIAVVGSACASGYLSITAAGVVVSAVFGLSHHCRWLAMLSSYITTHFAASERMLEYAALPNEEKEERGGDATTSHYTAEGTIVFVKFSASYRKDTPVILDTINVAIPMGKKTTLMGRSGCGKSTLVQGLLRMLYVREGDILIDGKSIYRESAHDHRELFSIVPQYPYLFAGSVRENLDKSLSISEEKVRDALTKVGLSLSPDTYLREGGDNLSMGERQLLSLARALLRDRPILLMDEPTSLIDAATDRQIQEVLRTEFKGKTVITIAHRIETIEDYDYAILMDEGRVITTGSPLAVREEARLLKQAA